MTPPAAQLVIGTAGHIDHGKTALVRVLTGVDLDALPEEQERGITIALGFVPLDLPDGRRVAFVDVPGHERLVRTMIAGATGLDAAILCVSALDGAMPQTREHLAILDLLGVDQGLVALTFADQVDQELLELAALDVEDLVQGTFLEQAPVIPCSGATGEGAEELVAALAELRARPRDLAGPFRLPVDRSFVQQGFGTVVTGTVWSGAIDDGATVSLWPQEREARVRGLEVHGHEAERAEAGWRAALNLAGIDPGDAPRGTVVADRPIPCPHMIDVRYEHLDDADPLEDRSPVRLLLGTAEAVGRIVLAGEHEVVVPGETVYAQVRLDAPVPCLPRDRFVIRRPSPQQTLGGGVVLDPWASKMKGKQRVQAAEELRRLDAGEVEVWLERAGEAGLDPAVWRFRAPHSDRGVILGDRVFAPRVVARLTGALLQALEAYHREAPLSLGAHRRELRRDRLGHLSSRVFDGLVERLAEQGTVVLEGPLVRAAGFRVEPTPAQAELRDAIARTLREAGIEGVDREALAEAHPQPETAALVRLLERDGVAEQVAGVGWVAAGPLARLRDDLQAWFAEHERLSPGQFKEMTGTTRRTAIPLLEWLDRQKWTRRTGDARVVGDRL